MDVGDGPDLVIGWRITGGSTLVVELSGYLDVEAMPRLAMCADDICSAALGHVQVQVSGLESLDDTGFQLLGSFCRMLQRRGCSLILVGPRPLVQNLLSRFWLAGSGEPKKQETRGAAARLGLRSGREAVPLSPVQQCELHLMETELCAQEPGLATMFAAYERLADD